MEEGDVERTAGQEREASRHGSARRRKRHRRHGVTCAAPIAAWPWTWPPPSPQPRTHWLEDDGGARRERDGAAHWLEDDCVMPWLDRDGEGTTPQIQGVGGM
jgi:hypothetical protein